MNTTSAGTALITTYGIIALISVLLRIYLLPREHSPATIMQPLDTVFTTITVLIYGSAPVARWVDNQLPGNPHNFVAELSFVGCVTCGLSMASMWKRKGVPLLPLAGCAVMIAVLTASYFRATSDGLEFSIMLARNRYDVAAFWAISALYTVWTGIVFVRLQSLLAGEFGQKKTSADKGLRAITVAALVAFGFSVPRLIAVCLILAGADGSARGFLAVSYTCFAATGMAFIIGTSYPAIVEVRKCRAARNAQPISDR